MSKIRTVNDLDDFISAEIAWRKQELTTALTVIQSSKGNAQTANLRAGVVLLYAHWEGWIKAVGHLYIRYVNSQGYTYDKLSQAFLGNALKTRMAAISEATTPLVHNSFALFIQEGLGKRAAVSESLIRTEGNLSSSVLLDIVDRLGLTRRELYDSRAPMIDHELVNRRNTIAHGQYLELELPEFVALRADTLELLELFTDEVRNAASQGLHLAAPQEQV
jgi:hypothetical protein